MDSETSKFIPESYISLIKGTTTITRSLLSITTMTIEFLMRKWSTPPCGTFVYDITLIPNCSPSPPLWRTEQALREEASSQLRSIIHRNPAESNHKHANDHPHPWLTTTLRSSENHQQYEYPWLLPPNKVSSSTGSGLLKSPLPSSLPLTENCITVF